MPPHSHSVAKVHHFIDGDCSRATLAHFVDQCAFGLFTLRAIAELRTRFGCKLARAADRPVAAAGAIMLMFGTRGASLSEGIRAQAGWPRCGAAGRAHWQAERDSGCRASASVFAGRPSESGRRASDFKLTIAQHPAFTLGTCL